VVSISNECPRIRDTAACSAWKSSLISSRLLESMFEYYVGLPTEAAAQEPLKRKWGK
jgi:hypothetical protein